MSTNHQALNELSQLCLYGATTKMCAVGGIRELEFGTTAVGLWLHWRWMPLSAAKWVHMADILKTKTVKNK
jgi:hypothetical protein